MNDFLTALSLLTIFRFTTSDSKISARALAYYPLVGLGIGIVLLLSNFLLRRILPDLVAAPLLVAL